MYAQENKSNENKSRAVANSVAQKKSNAKQGFEFVDNRLKSITQFSLKSVQNQKHFEAQDYWRDSEKHKPIQRLTVQSTNIQADQRALKTARQAVYPDAGTASHNFAVGDGYPRSWAHSNAVGHSEARAAANTLGIILGGNTNIEILSERAPCDSCRYDMNDIERSSLNTINVTVSYLVNHDDQAPINLRNIYQAL